MPTCENCGNQVSHDYVRVKGTNAGRVFACPACSVMTRVVDETCTEDSWRENDDEEDEEDDDETTTTEHPETTERDDSKVRL